MAKTLDLLNVKRINIIWLISDEEDKNKNKSKEAKKRGRSSTDSGETFETTKKEKNRKRRKIALGGGIYNYNGGPLPPLEPQKGSGDGLRCSQGAPCRHWKISEKMFFWPKWAPSKRFSALPDADRWEHKIQQQVYRGVDL